MNGGKLIRITKVPLPPEAGGYSSRFFKEKAGSYELSIADREKPGVYGCHLPLENALQSILEKVALVGRR